MFDEQPDGDPHGECAAEISRLTEKLEAADYEIKMLRAFCREVDVAAADAALNASRIANQTA